MTSAQNICAWIIYLFGEKGVLKDGRHEQIRSGNIYIFGGGSTTECKRAQSMGSPEDAEDG